VTLAGQTVEVATHLATLYDSDAARTRLAAPFLAEGIRAGQPCFLMAKGEELAGYMDALDAMPGVDVDGRHCLRRAHDRGFARVDRA